MMQNPTESDRIVANVRSHLEANGPVHPADLVRASDMSLSNPECSQLLSAERMRVMAASMFLRALHPDASRVSLFVTMADSGDDYLCVWDLLNLDGDRLAMVDHEYATTDAMVRDLFLCGPLARRWADRTLALEPQNLMPEDSTVATLAERPTTEGCPTVGLPDYRFACAVDFAVLADRLSAATGTAAVHTALRAA